MDSLRNCAKINCGLLAELALWMTRTIFLRMKVVTGYSHLFGLDSNPLSVMIYSKNLRTIWDVSLDVTNPLRLANALKQARKLVGDTVVPMHPVHSGAPETLFGAPDSSRCTR